MKLKGIIIAPRFFKFWSWLCGFKVIGVTFPYFIIIARKNKRLINHELIHRAQQYETLIIGFYLLYLGYYIAYRIKGYKHYVAYKSIPFEVEANAHEKDYNYLSNRKLYRWLNKNP